MKTEPKVRKPRTKKVKSLGKVEQPKMFGVAVYDSKWNYFSSLTETAHIEIEPNVAFVCGEGLTQFAFERSQKTPLEEDARTHWNQLSNSG
jgi:hypothetical protein